MRPNAGQAFVAAAPAAGLPLPALCRPFPGRAGRLHRWRSLQAVPAGLPDGQPAAPRGQGPRDSVQAGAAGCASLSDQVATAAAGGPEKGSRAVVVVGGGGPDGPRGGGDCGQDGAR